MTHFIFNETCLCTPFRRRRLQRIKLNDIRSCLPFAPTLTLLKTVPVWISSSSPTFYWCCSPSFTSQPPLVFRSCRFNPGFSTRFDTLHSGLYGLTRFSQHGTPCSYYCSYDPPILDRFILFHPRFSHYLYRTTPFFLCLMSPSLSQPFVRSIHYRQKVCNFHDF